MLVTNLLARTADFSPPTGDVLNAFIAAAIISIGVFVVYIIRRKKSKNK